MREHSLDTGPPRKNARAVAARNHHRSKGDDVKHPALAGENPHPQPSRQGNTYSKRPDALPGAAFSRLLGAAASRPSSELRRLLDIIEFRINFHRGKILGLVAERAAIQTELSRRDTIYGLSAIGGEVRTR